MQKTDTTEDRSGVNLTEAEDNKRWQEHTELYKKGLQFNSFQLLSRVRLFSTP